MVAYLGLQNSEFPRLLQTAEAADIAVTDELLVDGASNMEEARLWEQLSKDLHYILVSVCSGQAAVICRQHSTQAQGLETWRQATTHQVLDTSRYTQCRIPYKTT